jgi:hypothetical protein
VRKDELLLISACLATPENLQRQYSSWEEASDIDSLNYGLVRLIPYLYKKLTAAGFESPNKDVLRGIYRKFWVQRALMQASGNAVMHDLASLNEPVLLKGAALEHYIYEEDPATRPSDDIDLLISRGEFLNEIERLPDKGWTIDRLVPNKILSTLCHGASFSKNSLSVDLHWVIFPFNLDPGYEGRIRGRSTPVRQFDQNFLLPGPTDLLLHTIVHGAQANRVSPARWVLDATLLIQKTEIDWRLFIREGLTCGWSTELKIALTLLKNTFNLSQIPDYVFEDFASSSGSKSSRLAFASYRSRNIWNKRLIRFLWTNYLIYKTSLVLDGVTANNFLTWLRSLALGIHALAKFTKSNGLPRLLSSSDWAAKGGPS